MSRRIKFSYLYRDASNYKAWGEVVFDNADDLPLEEVETRLRKAFEVDGIFVAHQVHIPEIFLYADGSLTEADHCFHEFSRVEFSEEPPSDKDSRTIKAFVKQVELESLRGWEAFNPAERLLLTRKPA